MQPRIQKFYVFKAYLLSYPLFLAHHQSIERIVIDAHRNILGQTRDRLVDLKTLDRTTPQSCVAVADPEVKTKKIEPVEAEKQNLRWARTNAVSGRQHAILRGEA
jgi:hypothetical protein